MAAARRPCRIGSGNTRDTLWNSGTPAKAAKRATGHGTLPRGKSGRTVLVSLYQRHAKIPGRRVSDHA